MLALQITKRNVTRTVYIPFSPYWASKNADELAQAEANARAFYRPQNFRFVGSDTIYTRGRLRLHFGPDGYAYEGYSYNACLFTRAPASEDFPQGRIIWNDTQYSVTTNSKHRYLLMRFAQGPATSQRIVTEYYGEGEDRRSYTHREYEHTQWNERCEVSNMPWWCNGDTLREEILTWTHAHHAARQAREWNQYVREQRAQRRQNKRIAAGKHLRLVKEAV